MRPAVAPGRQLQRRQTKGKLDRAWPRRRRGLRGLPGNPLWITARVKIVQTHSDILCGQYTYQVVDLSETRSARNVGRHGKMRLASQDVADESSQIAARPRLYKQPHSVRLHVGYGLAEQNRADPIRPKQLT